MPFQDHIQAAPEASPGDRLRASPAWALLVLVVGLAACQDRGIVTEPVADSPAFSASNAQDDVYIVVLRSNVTDVDREADRLVRGANGDLGYVYRHALKNSLLPVVTFLGW